MLKSIITVALGGLVFIVLAELVVGCGQVTYFPDRTWVSNECLFIESEISYSRW